MRFPHEHAKSRFYDLINNPLVTPNERNRLETFDAVAESLEDAFDSVYKTPSPLKNNETLFCELQAKVKEVFKEKGIDRKDLENFCVDMLSEYWVYAKELRRIVFDHTL